MTALLASVWQHADAAERQVLGKGVAALGRRLGIDYWRVMSTREGLEL